MKEDWWRWCFGFTTCDWLALSRDDYSSRLMRKIHLIHNMQYSLGCSTVSRAEAWTLPAGFVPMHWNMPASMFSSPLILRLYLEKSKKTNPIRIASSIEKFTTRRTVLYRTARPWSLPRRNENTKIQTHWWAASSCWAWSSRRSWARLSRAAAFRKSRTRIPSPGARSPPGPVVVLWTSAALRADKPKYND